MQCEGVGTNWVERLQEMCADAVSDAEFAAAADRFPLNPPQSKEEYYYRALFEKHFGEVAGLRRRASPTAMPRPLPHPPSLSLPLSPSPSPFLPPSLYPPFLRVIVKFTLRCTPCHPPKQP